MEGYHDQCVNLLKQHDSINLRGTKIMFTKSNIHRIEIPNLGNRILFIKSRSDCIKNL